MRNGFTLQQGQCGTGALACAFLIFASTEIKHVPKQCSSRDWFERARLQSCREFVSHYPALAAEVNRQGETLLAHTVCGVGLFTRVFRFGLLVAFPDDAQALQSKQIVHRGDEL